MYTYEKDQKDSIRMKGDFTRGKILKFLLASSRPIPQEFDAEKIQTSIHHNMPVLLVYARTASTNTSLKNVLITTETLTKSFFHVYQLTDPQDPLQAPFFNDCDVG